MMAEYQIPARAKVARPEVSRLDVIVVGAGLGGLGAAISLLLSGHNVLVVEAASEISEIGAGIQILPNSSRVLQRWGMKETLSRYATRPKQVNFIHWKGGRISSMNMMESAKKHGGPGTFYWDFHRANLHACLLDRAVELGARIRTRCRVVDVRTNSSTAIVFLSDGEKLQCDLVVGADGINSRLRDILLGKTDKPIPTGDLAYRLLLSTKAMLKDPELSPFVTDPQVNYWLGPRAHAVNYVLRDGELFNMVLLVPDDMPEGASTLEGNVEEMRKLYKGWDPRIGKLLGLCESVYKWKLCIRGPLENWSNSDARFVLLGDAVHATLPYLASGAGMSLEDAEVLGLCLRRLSGKKQLDLSKALKLYERCRKGRTEMVVERGNLQQYLYHLDDGQAQMERDRRMKEIPTQEGEALAWRDPVLAPTLLGYDCEKAVEEQESLASKL